MKFSARTGIFFFFFLAQFQLRRTVFITVLYLVLKSHRIQYLSIPNDKIMRQKWFWGSDI